MSHSDRHATPAHLVVSAGVSSVDITVTDGRYREVGRGSGRLDLPDLPPGLYEIEARSGGIPQTRIVSLRPGERKVQYVADVSEIATIAPVADGPTSQETHLAALADATVRIRDLDGPPSGLVLMVRTLGYRSEHSLGIERLSLLDADLRPLPGYKDSWRRLDRDMATWSARLEPGGYVLRTRFADGSMTDQALWLSTHWTTIVVCPSGPNGPRPADAAIHMLELGRDWRSIDAGEAVALEVALSCLRQGIGLDSDGMMETLLRGKFANPMLGLVGVHAFLMRPDADPRSLRIVIGNLMRLVPDHPDLAALIFALPGEDRFTLSANRGRFPSRSRGRRGADGLRWPPMLMASYRDFLLPAEQRDQDVLAVGSVAERIAAYVTGAGPWLSWEATRDVLARVDRGVGAGPASVERMLRYLNRRRLPSAGSAPRAAVDALDNYINGAAQALGRSQQSIVDELGVAGLARRTVLPMISVSQALAELYYGSRGIL